jgi:hypothetical protein
MYSLVFFKDFVLQDSFALSKRTTQKLLPGQMSKLVHDNFTPPAGTTFSFNLQRKKEPLSSYSVNKTFKRQNTIICTTTIPDQEESFYSK